MTMFRSIFVDSFYDWFYFLFQLDLKGVVTETKFGVIVCFVIFLTSIAVACLREFIKDHEGGQEILRQLENPPVGHIDENAVNHNAIPAADVNPPQVVRPQHPVPAEQVEDVSLSEFLGFTGPWTSFLIQVISILIFNAVFLHILVSVPLHFGNCIIWMVTQFSKNYFGSFLNSFRAHGADFFERVAGSFFQNQVYESMFSIFLGYLLVFSLMILSLATFLAIFRRGPVISFFRAILRQIGIGFKLIFLLSCELIVCPLILGSALDVLTIHIRNTSWSRLCETAVQSPLLVSVTYWFFGFGFMFLISAVVALLRKTIKKEVLSKILRDPDDPDFHPLAELVDLPFRRHFRRLIITVLLYCSLLFLGIHLPTKIYVKFFPSLAPLRFRWSNPLELPADFVLCHVCFPFAVGRIRSLKIPLRLTKSWFNMFSPLLGLKSYLLPSEQGDNNIGVLPSRFALRLFALLVCAWITNLVMLFLTVTLPLLIGRELLSAMQSSLKSHDFHSLLFGINLLFVFAYCSFKALQALTQIEFMQYSEVMLKSLKQFRDFIICFLLFALVLPILAGLITDLCLVSPILIRTDEVPIIFLFQVWALGLVILRLAYYMLTEYPFGHTILGLRIQLLLLQRFGEMNHRQIFIIFFSFSSFMSRIIAVPCIVAYVLVASWSNPETVNTFLRYSFPAFLAMNLLYVCGQTLKSKLKIIRETVFKEKYLVRHELSNYSIHSGPS